MNLTLTWWLSLPLLLSVFYGYTQSRSKSILILSTGRNGTHWFATALVAAALTTGWSAVGFPLPIFFILAYVCQATRLLTTWPAPMKNWFLLNLSHAAALATHLILIGTAALIQRTTMYELLSSSFWRTISISTVLLIAIIQDLVFLLWPNFSAALTAQAESEEAKPFMAFLWFCAGYLLIDSTLCIVELEPLYPPLFLVGSSGVVLFTLIRFLFHIHALIKNNHLKQEHDHLSSQLEAAEESAGQLRLMADRDVLTGAYSRRYALLYMEDLLRTNLPFALVYMDLDGLKKINDSYGHDAGDVYLISFVKHMNSRLRDQDLLARLGGDEFLILLPGCTAEDATQRVQEIRGDLERSRQSEAGFRFSYGVTAYSDGTPDGEQLIRQADQAMYRDKDQRRREEGRL